MITAVDLFAGAGGASTGLLEAATMRGQRINLVAVNHWPIAIATHTENHPEARHYCTPIEALNPLDAVPSGKLDLLIAAPECTHHSTARGGRPINDQSRAGAWQILRWLDHLRVDHVLIENVPEFRTWGPLGRNNRPIQAKKGETFRAFLAAIESYGFTVDFRVLNAADYGAATTRRRLFIQAKRGRGPSAWPDATHSKTGSGNLFGGKKRWRAAREVIDWTLASESIFRRKRPLAPATMRRIVEGLRRFGGPELEPFLVILRNHMDGQPIDGPLPTIAAEGQHVGLAQPFIVAMEHGGRVVDSGVPLPTITTAKGGAFGVAEPMVWQSTHGGRARTVSGPLPTVTGANRGELGIVEPMILPQGGGGVLRPTSQPIPTVHGDGIGLVEPHLCEFYGNGQPHPITEPVPTVTTRDRFALVEPVVDGYVLDIRFRMLQPHELSAAMSFPKGYKFTGNKSEQVKQIGNAWDVSMGRAICGAILDGRSRTVSIKKIEVA